MFNGHFFKKELKKNICFKDSFSRINNHFQFISKILLFFSINFYSLLVWLHYLELLLLIILLLLYKLPSFNFLPQFAKVSNYLFIYMLFSLYIMASILFNSLKILDGSLFNLVNFLLWKTTPMHNHMCF